MNLSRTAACTTKSKSVLDCIAQCTTFTLLFSTACFGICINAGGPATSDCTADQFFAGGSPYVDTTAAPGSLQDMRFGSTFSYTIPAVPGFYLLTLSFVDPNVTAAGGRLFNVTVNGAATPNLDLAVLNGGAKKLYALRLPVISYGSIVVKFTTIVRSAIVNEIRLDQTPQISGISTLPVGSMAIILSDGSYVPVVVTGDPDRSAIAGVVMLRSCLDPLVTDACTADESRPLFPAFQWAYASSDGTTRWVPLFIPAPGSSTRP